MKEYICICNNCGCLMYDENPNTSQPKIDINNIEQPVVSMELINEEGDSYYGCPNCETDAYLMDVLNY